MRIEKMLATVLREAHEWQVEEVMEILSEGPEGFYRTSLDSRIAVFAASCRGETSFLGDFEHQKGGKKWL